MVVIGDSDMRMNRRKVLTALGGMTVGGGALFGTGAFSTVSAERTVAVTVEGDGSALIALAPSGAGANSSVIDTPGGKLEIDFGAAANTDEGLNVGAKTTVGSVNDDNTVANQAFDITNNSGSAVDLSFDIGFNSAQSTESISNDNPWDVLKLYADTNGATNATVGSSGKTGNFASVNINGLESTDKAEVAVQIDLSNHNSEDLATGRSLFEDSATITAESK